MSEIKGGPGATTASSADTDPQDQVAEEVATEDLDEAPTRSPLKSALIAAALIFGTLVLLVIAAKVLPGTSGTIARAMLREALAPGTAAMAIAIIGLNIHFGFTGILNMGQSGYMLLGAYGFSISIWHGLPMWLGILIGLGLSVLFSLFLGVPTLKLRGDYIAMVTISAAEILRFTGRLAALEDFSGAAQGIPGSGYRDPFVNLSFLPQEGTWNFIGIMEYQWTGVNGWWVRLVAWALVAVCTVVVALLVLSPWGRLLRGIREDEDAIRSLGKNVFAVKMQALIIGGLFGSIAGMLYILPSSMQPDAMGRNLTFFAWTALLLGGAASVFGPVLGSILFFSVRILIQGTAGALVPPEIMNTAQTKQFAWVCVGIALMALVVFRPQGILGNKKEVRFNV